VVVDEVVGRFHVAKKPDAYVVLEDNFGTKTTAWASARKTPNCWARSTRPQGHEGRRRCAEISKKWFGENIVK
jgi:hypothetical protein